ncbi:hypothetical protein VNO80_04224 [Phaseolus coccineus]|uniref:BZIP domain-containing protein n=1 Tax=Phaseolus coccineus TaxID=3886 RepID=A0AAN9NTS9_PHACN
MDAESEKRASASISPSFPYEHMDRLVDREEMEAAETLAQLAMRDSHYTDKWCTKPSAIPELQLQLHLSPTLSSDPSLHLSPTTLHSDSSLDAGEQAIAVEQLEEKVPTSASVEAERTQQDKCLEHMEVEQDANLLHNSSNLEGEQDANLFHNSSNLLGRFNKPRRILTEEEKEARRIRRILANRESARQTIRRRQKFLLFMYVYIKMFQALCEELTNKAATLVVENESLKREKDLALKEYQSLETTNKYLKAQIAKSINTEVEKTPVEPELSVAEVTPSSGNSPWFLYNHFPVQHVFWPSPLQPTYPVHLPNTSFNSIVIPSIANVPCSSESDSYHKQNNLINDKQTPNPFYMFPCPWIFPCPQFANGQSSPSCSLKDKQNILSLGKPCSSSSSLNTLANVDYQAWTEARLINNPSRFSLNGGEKITGCHIIENYHGPTLGCNGHACSFQQENQRQLHSAPNNKASAPNNKASATANIAASSLEKKQEQFICQGKSLADAVAAAEARKRRKELTKQKSIHNRHPRMQC